MADLLRFSGNGFLRNNVRRAQGGGNMVSMKTKLALIADINGLVGAVGDMFEPDDDGDAERDFMAERCPPRLEHAVRTLPTLSMHLLAVVAEGPVSVVGLAGRSHQ